MTPRWQYAKTIGQLAPQLTPAEAIEILEYMVNGHEAGLRRALAEAIPRMHPTLQQCLGRVFLAGFDTLAAERHPDARNMHVVALARRVKELDHNLPLV